MSILIINKSTCGRFFLMQNINYYFYSIQAPLVQPITEPRIANSCGDTIFPKTLSISDPPNIQHLESTSGVTLT